MAGVGRETLELLRSVRLPPRAQDTRRRREITASAISRARQ